MYISLNLVYLFFSCRNAAFQRGQIRLREILLIAHWVVFFEFLKVEPENALKVEPDSENAGQISDHLVLPAIILQ